MKAGTNCGREATTTARLTETLVALLGDALTKHYDRTCHEQLTLCHVCNRWEEHAPNCPIPTIQHWLRDVQACVDCGPIEEAFRRISSELPVKRRGAR